MDRVQNQVTSMCSDLKGKIDRIVQEMKTEMRTEFKATLGKKAVSLETYVEMRVNEVCQSIASTLEQLKETVAAVRESQERMWRAIDGMSTEVQQLVQRDAGIEDEEDTKPLPIVENPAKEEPIPTETSAIFEPTPKRQFLHDPSPQFLKRMWSV